MSLCWMDGGWVGGCGGRRWIIKIKRKKKRRNRNDMYCEEKKKKKKCIEKEEKKKKKKSTLEIYMSVHWYVVSDKTTCSTLIDFFSFFFAIQFLFLFFFCLCQIASILNFYTIFHVYICTNSFIVFAIIWIFFYNVAVRCYHRNCIYI